ncbi:MAG: T9SS type A sorting domain-containing protein [Bacteroidota bacterium]
MKKHLLLFALLYGGLSLFGQTDLIITGVVDGPLPGGVPKAVEVYALADIADLSEYGLGSANNGGGTDGVEFEFPAITARAGDFMYVTSSGGADDFEAFFGFPATFADPGGAVLVNGDDAVELFKNGVVVDVFGDINVDGTGEAWEYLDGWAYRNNFTGPDGTTFDINNWSFSGPNALDNETSNATAATPFPLKSFSSIVADGTVDGAYGEGLCIQDTPTGQDNTDASDTLANGFELNVAYARVEGGFLYVMTTGNVRTDGFTRIVLAIDSKAGGQNRLLEANPDAHAFNNLEEDSTANGFTFDPDFEADYLYTFSNGIGAQGYRMFPGRIALNDTSGVPSWYGSGTTTITPHASGHIFAVNNSNIGGVTTTSVANATQVTTGAEFAIPLSEIDNPSGEIKITAFLSLANNLFMFNQYLCGLGDSIPDLANPRTINLADIPGEQFFTICAGVDGGFVSTEDGEYEVFTCPGDGIADIVRFDSTTTQASDNYAYVITDLDGVILGLPPADSADLDGAGVGTCLVWGLSYSGNLTAMLGDTATSVALSDSCYELSSNFITIYRELPEAGTVLTEAGEDSVNVLLVGSPVNVAFDSSGTSNSNYLYVVTDPATQILGVSTNGVVDFSGADPGECWVWGLAYTGNLLVGVGDTVATAAALTDECWDLSDDFVKVVRDTLMGLVGGTVSTESGDTTVFTCPGDGNPDVIAFDSTVIVPSNFTYVVTDENTVILAVPPGDEADFEGAGTGTCLVWGLHYYGNLTAMVGDTAATAMLADSSFALSTNFVTVYRDTPRVDMVLTEAGEDTVRLCLETGESVVSFDSAGTSNSQFAYVITDVDTKILGINTSGTVDFGPAGPGECWVWGLSYTGNVLVSLGDTVTNAPALTDDCWDLTDDFVVVFRDSVAGGMVTAASDTLVVDFNDSTTYAHSFDSTGTAGPNFTYVVTDTATKILGLPGGDMVDFGAAGPGICYVWGLSYSGNVLAALGDTAATTILTDGCFDLSDNFIVVVRDSLTTGLESLAFGVVSVFPVPTHDVVKVSFEGVGLTQALTEVRVFSAAGQLIETKETRGSELSFDLSAYSDGLYLLQLTNGAHRVTRRLIKE